jgi:hypothetical protein
LPTATTHTARFSAQARLLHGKNAVFVPDKKRKDASFIDFGDKDTEKLTIDSGSLTIAKTRKKIKKALILILLTSDIRSAQYVATVERSFVLPLETQPNL